MRGYRPYKAATAIAVGFGRMEHPCNPACRAALGVGSGMGRNDTL